MWLNRYPAQNFFGFGGGKAAGPAPATSPASGQNNGQPNSQNVGAPNAGVQQPQGQGSGQPQPSELDVGLQGVASLWEAGAKAAATTGAAKSPYADFTDEALNKAFGAARISTTIKPEVISGLFDGNQEKAAAFAQILDQSFQAGLNMAAKNSIKLSELGINSTFETFKSTELPQYLTQQQVSNSVLNANPILSNPAYKPVFDLMVSGLTAQFPNATQAQISEHAAKHIKNLAEGLSPQQTNTNTANLQPSNVTSAFADDFFK